MNEHIKDGGPAFPQPGVYDGNRNQVYPVGAYYDAGCMSIAYNKRKKAIRRGAWDFSAQTRRQAWQYFRQLTADERQTEIERFVTPPTVVERVKRFRLPSFQSTNL